MTLEGFNYTPADFKVTGVKLNNCAGCWFAEQMYLKCTDRGAAEFVNEVFKTHPGNTNGSCAHLIATLKVDEV